MAVRISGVTLQDDKGIGIALTDIYGIGRSLAADILTQADIDPSVKTKELTDAEVTKLRDHIEEHIRVEGELRREENMNIKHHMDLGTYRGMRHSKNLPVHGQRTRKNSRTVRGNVRRTAGSGRAKSADKT